MDDPINNPRHYQFGQLEAWDIIELAIENTPDPVTAYHQASALKYLLRAARKNGAEDIAKAFAHLKREVARHAVRIPPSPDYDPASVAFRHGDLDDLRRERSGQTAVELAAIDGVSEYGNPVTPGCATTPWRLP